jgi:hypothetical protein
MLSPTAMLRCVTKLAHSLPEMSLVAMASDKSCYYEASIPKENETLGKYKFTQLSRGILKSMSQTYAKTICFLGGTG